MTLALRWLWFGRVFMATWALFAVPTTFAILILGLGAWQLGVASGFVVWGGVWIWFWLRALGRSRAGEAIAFIALTVLGTVFSLIEPNPATTILVFSFVIAGCIFPPRRAVIVFVALAALDVAIHTIRFAGVGQTVNTLINDVLVGGVAIGARLMVISYGQLIAAREEIARLAVSEERLRFSRDLHDILGQSLAVVVLKSELVAKQLPAAVDESLRQELRDVARVARKSLNDVREAVSGYRRPSLTAEIGNARSALRAAGIGLRLEDTLGRVPPEQDAVLAWCVREGVTNVIKHSGAKHCVVRLAREDGSARLEVEDDGTGTEDLGGGSGLVGLRERVELAGGKFEIGPGANRGLRLLATIPAGLPAPSELAVS